MTLKKNDYITSVDPHGEKATGKITKFLEHTVIVETTEKERFVFRKKELKKQGYSFPPFKKEKIFSPRSDGK